MLVNLLSNGVKFTPAWRRGGWCFRARPGRCRRARHRDRSQPNCTGTGISKADLARLGKPFEQVENAETRAKEGTGLGLALVKSLTAMHGGEAVLESVMGEGTTVHVRLPHAAVDSAGKCIAPPKPAKILPFRAVS